MYFDFRQDATAPARLAELIEALAASTSSPIARSHRVFTQCQCELSTIRQFTFPHRKTYDKPSWNFDSEVRILAGNSYRKPWRFHDFLYPAGAQRITPGRVPPDQRQPRRQSVDGVQGLLPAGSARPDPRPPPLRLLRQRARRQPAAGTRRLLPRRRIDRTGDQRTHLRHPRFILRAVSTASDPELEKNTLENPAGASSHSFSASSNASGWLIWNDGA